MHISIVVAVSENNAIGGKGDLLWRLPADLKRFKEITYGHHVLMGRKTYESIPEKFRPLPGRVNIVVSRKENFMAAGCKTVGSVEEGIQFAKDNGENELMIIGGGEIYRQVFHKTDKVYLTKVRHVFESADTFFPALNESEWKIANHTFHKADSKHAFDFSFLDMEKKQ